MLSFRYRIIFLKIKELLYLCVPLVIPFMSEHSHLLGALQLYLRGDFVKLS